MISNCLSLQSFLAQGENQIRSSLEAWKAILQREANQSSLLTTIGY